MKYNIPMKNILIINGSPKKNGNTAKLISWFREGIKGARIEAVNAADLKFKVAGCNSCRVCQKIKEYKCVIRDGAGPVLNKMTDADVIVMATPLYFYGPSAQLKVILDRMFCLFKWDNKTDVFSTPLKGKTLVLLASAYEDIGLDTLAEPFRLTADYAGMKFKKLLVRNAGESGEIGTLKGIKSKIVKFSRSLMPAS